MTHIRQDLKPTRDIGLVAIACFKLFKAAALVGLGLGAFQLVDPATVDRLSDWLSHVTLSAGQEIVDRLVDVLSTITSRRATAIGIGAMAYGSLFAVEGIGLWKGRRWAEYLTVITTGLLIPVEIYEITRRLTVVRISAFMVNVLAVMYLVYRLRHPRPDLQPSAHVRHETAVKQA
jgi:uncharacterized membrane protein (DUF2068 family)